MCALFVRVKELRVALGLTQAELADRAGVRRATVSRIENAQVSGIDFSTLERLADVLGVEPGLLIGRLPPGGVRPVPDRPSRGRPGRRAGPRRPDGAT
jgi:transcriptional regulator with XRE-family HTH domain